MFKRCHPPKKRQKFICYSLFLEYILLRWSWIGIDFLWKMKHESPLWFVTCQSNSSGATKSLFWGTNMMFKKFQDNPLNWLAFWMRYESSLWLLRIWIAPGRPQGCCTSATHFHTIFYLKYLKHSERMKMKVKRLWIQNETWISLSGMASGVWHLELPKTRFVTASMLGGSANQRK